jgi:hypothetical protein
MGLRTPRRKKINLYENSQETSDLDGSSLKIVTINNYDSLSELHTPKVTVNTAHIRKPS